MAALFLLFITSTSAQIQLLGQNAILAPGRPTLFRFSGAGSMSLELNSANAAHAEILLEASAPGVEFTILAPDGRPLQTISQEYPGWIALSLPMVSRGGYRLKARATVRENQPDSIAFHAVFLPFSATGGATRSKAEVLFNSAQTLSHSAKADGLRQAIDAYQHAVTAWAAAGESEGQVLALACAAQSWLGLSEYNKATAALQRAAAIGGSSRYWRAWLANLQAQVLLDKWDIGSARKNAEEALRMSHDLDDDWLLSDALADRGESEYLTHNLSAKKDIAEALRLARTIGSVGTIARALRCSAWMEKDQGHLTRALSLLDQAREDFHNDGEIRPELQAIATLVQIENTSGDIYSTLLRHSQLATLMQGTGYAAHYAIVLDDIGRDYAGLNRIHDAIVYFRQALAAYRTIHHASGEAAALFYLCSAEQKENHLTEALRDCAAAAKIVEQFHDPWRLGDGKWSVGTVQRALGQTSLAIDSFRQAAALSHKAENMIGEAQALMDWGDTLEGAGKREEARTMFDEALPLSETAETKPLQLEILYRIARSDFEAGRDEDATRNLKVALNTIGTLRRSVGNGDLQSSYIAQMRKCHDLSVDILMKEQDFNPSSGAAARALEMSESGRALTLLDRVAARDAGVGDVGPIVISQEVRELHTTVERAFDQRLKLMIEGGRSRRLDANAAELTRAINTLERTEDARKAALTSPGPTGRTLTAAEIAAASAKDHATLVEYSLGVTRSYAWVIQGGEIKSYVLPGRERIASVIHHWRDLATARISRSGEGSEEHRRRVDAADKELSRVAANLSCFLLDPFLQPRMERLEIVVDGELQLLPFAALPINGCQGGAEPVAARHQVTLTPSLSVLFAPHATKQSTFLGDVAIIADPVFDSEDPRVHRMGGASQGVGHSSFARALPRLAGTREEAEAIEALAGSDRTAVYLDFNASLQTLLSPSPGNYRVLHLASHGVLDESTPGFSGIVLSLVDSKGQAVFGYLKSIDVAALNLHSELVVLSSCDSAAGLNLSGEGVIGLSHAFLSAGARRVVTTLWSVDDEASMKLMTLFYSGMLHEGLEPSDALRQSQVKMMQDPRTAAPFYWAAFSITSTIQ